MLETDKNSSNIQEKKYQEKLKRSIQILFKQLKSGCGKKVCYNKENCTTAIGFDKHIYSSMNDKELITCCIKRVQSTEVVDTLLCIDLSKYSYSSVFVAKFEDWIHVLSNEDLVFNPKLCIPLANNSSKYNNELDIYSEIKAFSSVINQIFKEHLVEALINNNSEGCLDLHISAYESTLTESGKLCLANYLIKIYFNFINFLIINNKFDYNVHYKKDITEFFENFSILIIYFKKLRKLSSYKPEKDSLMFELFKEYSRDKIVRNVLLNNNNSNNNANKDSVELFNDCINNFHNFLTILVLELTQEHSEPSIDDLKVLVGLLRVFELFYWANKNYGLISKTLFENEKVNNYLSLKVQCSSYFKYHHNKDTEKINIISNEVDYFSFIKYYFLYDSASKKDIITAYNSRLQVNEVMSVNLDLESMLINQTFHITFKVRRNDLIKSTLDIISKNHNFRKPLKVSLI